MEEIILNAFERTTRHKKLGENGFIAGVLYGDSVKESIVVNFEELPLKKVLSKHGSNAKVWVKYGEEKNFGFIKEIQRHPVTAKIVHIDVQFVSLNHEIKMQIPIIFKGEASLFSKQLQLQIHKSEIHVFGKMSLMPDAVSVDVSEKDLGYIVTIKDFDLDKQIKVTDKEDENYAAIAQLKEIVVEEVAVAPVESVVEEPVA